jgi:hypothetical protein
MGLSRWTARLGRWLSFTLSVVCYGMARYLDDLCTSLYVFLHELMDSPIPPLAHRTFSRRRRDLKKDPVRRGECFRPATAAITASIAPIS